MKARTSRRLVELTGLSHGFIPDLGSGPCPPPWRPIQVHGAQIPYPATPAAKTREADAAVARPGGPAVGVITADCVPLLQVEQVGPCTICSTQWPSWRRQGPQAGSALAWIAPALKPFSFPRHRPYASMPHASVEFLRRTP